MNILVDGAQGIGKYALWVRIRHSTFVENGRFDPACDPSRSMIMVDGEQEFYDISWTTKENTESGLDDLKRKNSHAIILMYSVDSPESFDKLAILWEKMSKIKEGNKFPAVVIANKIDLPEHNISIQHGEEFARRLGVPFLAVSLRTGEGVDKIIPTVVREFRKKLKENYPNSQPRANTKLKRECTVC